MINYRDRQKKCVFSCLLLVIWTILGLVLRFANLDAKPASSIEIATVGYSLGHGFNAIAIDRIVSLDTLLSPLRLDTSIAYGEIFTRLRNQSTHPPLYFWLTRYWISLWLQNGDLVTLQIARSLSAVFGTLAIPAMFGLSWVAFRSRLVGHFAAICMAISPYGIYLAQEARHYTLTVLFVIASLSCLFKTLELIQQRITIPIWLGLIWTVVNALGIATHFFFTLVLAAEAIAVVVFWSFHRGDRLGNYIRGLSVAGVGTLAGGLVWLPIVRGISGNEMTSWIQTSYQLNEILLPVPRLIAWMITMVMLLPVEGTSTLVTICSGVAVLLALIWTVPILIKQWRSLWRNSATRSSMIMISGYLLGCLLIFLLVIYGMGKDVSLAARYHFVYFPGLILLIAVALASCCRAFGFNSASILATAKNRVVVLLLILGLLGSFTVINDFGFQKSRQSDRMAAFIQENSLPTLVAMTHRTHSELREMVALGLSWQRLKLKDESRSIQDPQFLLVSNNADAVANLDNIIAQQPKPLALFGVNLDLGDESLQAIGCSRDKTVDLKDSGYRDRFYLCQ